MSSGLCHRQHRMRIVISEFISLDGVVQAPGGPDEDTDGGFQHGGWSMPFFDPEVMVSSIDEVAERTDALLYGRRTWQVMAGAWPGRAGDPFADWRRDHPPRQDLHQCVRSPRPPGERSDSRFRLHAGPESP